MIQIAIGVKERRAEKQAGDILGDLIWLFPGGGGGRKHLLQTYPHPVLLGRHVPQGCGVVETTSLHYTLRIGCPTGGRAYQPIRDDHILHSVHKMSIVFLQLGSNDAFNSSNALFSPPRLRKIQGLP